MYEKSHQKFVDKVVEQNTEILEQGETVEAAVGGQTGPVHTSPAFALADTVRRLTGGLQSRVVILTDRNLYVGHIGIKPTIKELKLKCSRAEAPQHLSMRGGVMHVDGERIHFNIPQGKFAKRLGESLAQPASAETAAEG
jgi:hypothetical protein